MVWNALEASGAFVRCGRRRGGRVVGLWPEGEKRLGEPTQWCHQAVSMRRPQSVAGPGPSAAFRTRDEPCGKSAVFAQKKNVANRLRHYQPLQVSPTLKSKVCQRSTPKNAAASSVQIRGRRVGSSDQSKIHQAGAVLRSDIMGRVPMSRIPPGCPSRHGCWAPVRTWHGSNLGSPAASSPRQSRPS
jgi:hypothetical protein